MTAEPRYHATLDRNGTEDEITVRTPDGREMASIQFWDTGTEGAAEAEADARLIVDALNAFAAVAPRQPAETIGGEGKETLERAG